MKKILIVDDEQDIAELLREVLTSSGYQTQIITDSSTVVSHLKTNQYDLVLLDIMMPKITGTELIIKIREIVRCPIIFITAKNTIVSKILGFELGADDYITKPFNIEELVARINAHIRRENRETTTSLITIGQITINSESYEVKKNNKIVELSTREFEVLEYLMNNAGQVLSKEQIFNSVWGAKYGDIGTVAVHIKNIRTKLDKDEKYIITVWGVGYKFIKEYIK